MCRSRLIFLALFVLAAPVSAATIYVDGTLGADCTAGDYSIVNRTCTGSDGDAYNEISECAANMSASDICQVRGGTYAGTGITNTLPDGTAGNPTTLQNHPGETVTWRPTSNGGIRFTDTNTHVWLSFSADTPGAFVLDGVNQAGDLDGIGVNSTAQLDNAVIRHWEILNWQRNCIQLHDFSENNTVEGNILHDCGLDRFHHGVYVHGDNNTIIDNDIYNLPGYGVHCFHSGGECAGNTIARNLIHNTGTDGAAVDGALIANGDNNRIEANVIYDGVDHGILIDFSGGVADSNLLYHNTITGMNIGIRINTDAEADNTDIANNLVFGNTTAISNNDSSSTETCNRTADPTFVDSANDNYRLRRDTAAAYECSPVSGYTLDADTHAIRGGSAVTPGAYSLWPQKIW